jgi:type I restriction-modification system DNA methylase subunit
MHTENSEEPKNWIVKSAFGGMARALRRKLWQIADLLRGPSRPLQYERVMLPMAALRRFDCVLALTKGEGFARTRKAQRRQAK